MEQNSTLKLIPSKYWNKSQDRYILFSTLDFLEKIYILVIRRSSCSKVQQSTVILPWALIQTSIHFTPVMGVNAKSGTTCGF